jgi:hypothetical protein
VQLAARDTANRVISTTPRVVGYRRVLGSGVNCGLCIVASTQRYGRDDLMPIHPNCGCTVEPIIGQTAPPKVLDKGRVDLIKSQLRSEDLPYTRQAMSRLRIDVDELPTVEIVDHPELGPTLWNQAHDFAKVA